MKKERPGELRMRVAENLKTARQLSRLTQLELAELADLHLTAVQKFERLINAPTVDSVQALANALRLPPHVLFLEPKEALIQMTTLLPSSKAP